MPIEIVDALGPKYGSSRATRRRRHNKRKLKGGKPGNPGLFHGPRGDFLAEHLETFISLKGASRKAQDSFWRQLFQKYWGKWPWYIPIDKEPGEAVLTEPDTTIEEVLVAKGEVIKQTQQRSVFQMKHHNPWAPVLQELAELTQPLPGARRLAPWQLYMTKNAEAINSTFETKWSGAGLPENHALAFRGQIARDMLEQESEQYRQALEDELQQMELDEKTTQEATSTEARMTAQASNSREDAQDNIAVVVQPLLELLRDNTGYYLTLFAGIPLSSGEEEFKMKIITAGKTAGSPGLPWHMCEPEPFESQVVASFTRFLMKTPEWAQRVANTSDGPSMQPQAPTTSSTSSLPRTTLHSPVLPSTSSVDQSRGANLPSPNASADKAWTHAQAQTKSKSKSQPRPEAKGRPHGKGKECATSPSKQEAVESGRSEDEEDESDESDESDKDDDGQEEEDEEVGDDGPNDNEGDEDGEDQEGLEDHEHTSATIPTAAELGLSQVIQDELARLPARERRAHLYRFSRMTPFDRTTMNGRARAAALLNTLQPTPIPLYLFPLPVKRPKGASKKLRKSAGQATRKSGRLAAKVADPSTTTTSTATPPTSLAPQSATPPLTTAPHTLEPQAAATTALAASTSSTSPRPDHPVLTSALVTPGPTDPSEMRTTTALPDMALRPSPAAPALTDIPTTTSNSSASGGTLPDPTARSSVSPEDTSGPLSTAGIAGADLIMLDEDGWPSWLREAFDYMENQQLGKDFMRAVEWWTVLEHAHGFETSSRGLGTTHRPPEVHHWLRVQRRVLDKPPVIDDEAANGMLIVLLSLVWWRAAASSETLNDWNMAVMDVSYVVVAMAQGKLEKDRQGSTGKRSSDEVNDDLQLPSKRRRVPA
ncbi:hypothetical protein ACG7TL_001763 [Trametes sanguinea]